MSRFFSIYFTITGAKNIVRYNEDFLISRLVISRFYCNFLRPLTLEKKVRGRRTSLWK